MWGALCPLFFACRLEIVLIFSRSKKTCFFTPAKIMQGVLCTPLNPGSYVGCAVRTVKPGKVRINLSYQAIYSSMVANFAITSSVI